MHSALNMDLQPECQPEELALLFVQQYLAEQGFTTALAALEKDAGLLYDDSKLKQGSQLMQLVWGHMETLLSKEEQDEAAAARRAEEEEMLRGGSDDYAIEPAGCIDNVHPSTITCVRLAPGGDAVLTGAGDGHVRKVELSGDVAWQTRVGSGGVLCLGVDTSTSGPSLLAAGSMDGSLSILDASTGSCLCTHKTHSKYLIRVVWVPGQALCVTASQDQSVAVHRFVAAAAGDEGQGELRGTLELLKQLPYTSAVHDITLLRDGRTLVVALKGTNYLRLLDLEQLQAPEQKVNMNEAGDDHVSFSARHLALSPDGRFLLVSTDTPRLLMLRTVDWSVARSFFATAEQFHNPVSAWHRDNHYIYVAATAAEVWVFHVGTSKVVAKIQAHKINVRDLVYDAQRNLLVTCSFDKSVKLFRQKGLA